MPDSPASTAHYSPRTHITSHLPSRPSLLVRTLLVPAHVMSHSPPLTMTLPSALVGEVDDEKDSAIDYTEIRAEPISEIRH